MTTQEQKIALARETLLHRAREYAALVLAAEVSPGLFESPEFQLKLRDAAQGVCNSAEDYAAEGRTT